MKSNINNIRYRACREMLLYRALYNKYIKEPYILPVIVDRIWLHYKLIIFIYECGLISIYARNRACYMYNRIKKKVIRR